MVAERVQVRARSPANLCLSANPLTSLSRLDTMDSHGDFTPGFAQNMAQLEQQGQTDPVALLLGMVGAARAMAPLGRRAVEAVIKLMQGNTLVDTEQVFAQVDWQQPGQLSPTSSSGQGDTGRRSARRVLGFEDVQLTPEERQRQQQQPQQQQPRQQQQGMQGHVATQVRQWNDGRPPQPTDITQTDPDMETKKQIEQINEQMLHEGVVANKGLGERPIVQREDKHPNTWESPTRDHPMQIPSQDPWARERQKSRGQLATSIIIIDQLLERVTKLETAVERNQNVGDTPMIKNIATPPLARTGLQSPIDIETVGKSGATTNKVTENRRIIRDGMIYEETQSRNSGGTPCTAREVGPICQLGGGGQPGGGPNGPPEDDDSNLDGDMNAEHSC